MQEQKVNQAEREEAMQRAIEEVQPTVTLMLEEVTDLIEKSGPLDPQTVSEAGVLFVRNVYVRLCRNKALEIPLNDDEWDWYAKECERQLRRTTLTFAKGQLIKQMATHIQQAAKNFQRA